MIDLMDLHTHTLACGHAYNTLYEMARSASEKGVPLFGSSDHAPAMPGSCHKYYFTNFRVIPRTLFGMPLLMGAELNITDFDGQVDLPQDILRKMDYAIASIHIQCIDRGTAADYTRAYVSRGGQGASYAFRGQQLLPDSGKRAGGRSRQLRETSGAVRPLRNLHYYGQRRPFGGRCGKPPPCHKIFGGTAVSRGARGKYLIRTGRFLYPKPRGTAG